MAISEKIAQIIEKVMIKNKSRSFTEVLEILEIELRKANVSEEQIKMIKDAYSKGFYGNIFSKTQTVSNNNRNDELNLFGTIMTNPHHDELVEQEKRDDMRGLVEYFEPSLKEAKEKSTKKAISKKKKMKTKIAAIILAIITFISTMAIVIKANEEELFRLIQKAVIEYRLENAFDEVSKQKYPILLDDQDFIPTMNQEEFVNNYNKSTKDGTQLVPNIPNEVAVVAGAELTGNNKGLYGAELANQASLALTGKNQTDVYSTYVNGYQYQYGPIQAKDVVEYTVDKMWKEIEARREAKPEQSEGDDLIDKRGIYRA